MSRGYCPDWTLWRRCRVSNECILFKFVWYHFKNNNISGRKTLILFCLKSVSRFGNVNVLKLNLTIRYRTKRRFWPFHSFHLVLFILNAFSSYRFCTLNIKTKLIIRACFLLTREVGHHALMRNVTRLKMELKQKQIETKALSKRKQLEIWFNADTI